MTDVVAQRAIAERAPPRTRGIARRLKRLILLLVVGAVLAGGGLYGRNWWLDGRFIESTDDAYVGGDTVAVAPHVAGFVASVDVVDNQSVAAGQILVHLDDRDMRAALERAQAIRRQREAVVDSLRGRLALQGSTIAQAAADLDEKAAQAVFAQKDADRYSGLVNTTAVTRQEVERSTSLGKASRATVAAARAALDGAKQQLVVLKAQLAEAEAAIAQAAAEVRTAELDLGYTLLRSPVEGTVGNRAVRPGAYVAVGTYLMSVVPAHDLWIDANFKEDQLRRIRVGNAATMVADVAPGEPIHGRVLSLAPGTGAVFSIIPPENATGNFTKIVQRVPVRIQLDRGDGALGRLRPGLSATVSVDTRTNADVASAPSAGQARAEQAR